MITVILLIIIILTLLLATDSIIYLNRAVPANYNINGWEGYLELFFTSVTTNDIAKIQKKKKVAITLLEK